MKSLVLPAIQADTPLPANPEGVAVLEEKVAEIGQGPEPQPVPPLPETAGRISGRKILLDENDIGWKNVQLDFPGGDEAKFTIDDGTQTISAPVGLDNVPRVVTYGKPEIGEGIIVASWGGWEGSDVFSFTVDQENIFDHQPVLFTLTLRRPWASRC